MSEDQDYDFVTRRLEGDTVHFTPVQLKELVSDEINPRANLETELQKLTKYSSSSDLVVVIRVNRNVTIDRSKLRVPQLKIAQLWILGNRSPDQTKWCLIGDILNRPEITEFDYPVAH